MNSISINWKTALCTGVSLLCELALKMLQVSFLNHTTKQADSAINEILFYGSEDEDKKKQTGLDNLLCIYYLILHASRSIDVCMPSLLSDTTAKCFITARQKNQVKIRITIHSSDEFRNLQLFAENGIEVKVIKPNVRLEHEFILIDVSEGLEEAVAVLGSLDYDTTRVNCNRDATLLTSEVAVVKTLQREFERVWNYAADLTRENYNVSEKKLV